MLKLVNVFLFIFYFLPLFFFRYTVFVRSDFGLQKLYRRVLTTVICLSLIINHAYFANQTVGSDTTSGGAISYLQLDGSENKIANYALMNDGFSLLDLATTCSFASVYSVAGGFFMQGGKVFLNRDLVFDSHYVFGGGGQIYGNNYSLTLNNPNFVIEFFKGNFGSLVELDNYNIGNDVYTSDWSYDDKYIVSGANHSSSRELRIFSFDGYNMTSVYSANYQDDVNSARWHPNDYYLAIGVQGVSGDDFIVYRWDPGTNTLTKIDGVGAGNVRAVSWSNDGRYVAIGLGNDYVKVYSFDGNSLTFIDQILISGSSISIYRNDISWNGSGNYIAVGCRDNNGNSLRVLNFDGSNLTQIAQENIGETVKNVNWRRNTDLIAVGLNGSSQRLRIYSFDGSTLTDITSAYVDENRTVFALHWSRAGNYLAMGRDAKSGDDFRIYYYDNFNDQLLLLSGIDVSDDVYTVRWSWDDRYILMGSRNNKLYVYGIDRSDLYFYDTNLFFNSNLNLKMPIYLSNCVLNLNGNVINLQQNSLINVLSGSNLTIKNAEIYGLNKQNLRCLSDDSSITFENCKLTLTSDYLFDVGSIKIVSDVNISGTSCFTYASRQTSTIDSFAMLHFEQGTTFSYAPRNNKRDLIYMSDFTSSLFLDGATLKITLTGIEFTRGTLLLDNKVTFSAIGSSLSESISIGDGNLQNNLNLNILSSAELNIYGPFKYNNVN